MATTLYKFTEADYEYLSEQIVEAFKNGETPSELNCDDFLVELKIDYDVEDERMEAMTEFMGSYEWVTVYEIRVKKIEFVAAYTEDGDDIATEPFDCTKLDVNYKDWDGEIRVN